MSAGQDAQLRAIAEIEQVTRREGIPVWLRGGWAMDFFLGRVTRPHLDVDWFCWAADADRLADVLAGLGFVAYGDNPPDLQRDFLRDGVDLGVALLGQDAAGRVVVPAGPYAGAPWPDGMLAAPPGRLGDLTCAVISPAAQLEIKKMMPVWVPGMPRRDKDRADIALLQAGLTAGNAVAGA
ncbi:aminoglycoside adenylyltransferase [Catellatospora sp. NPDC049609]|uniref:nucleotidyltransferase domain-containing protein n=1 Tax=Catellatospora sp. NPDC049609 TaxID=3155505 RepID=UPI00341A5EF0